MPQNRFLRLGWINSLSEGHKPQIWQITAFQGQMLKIKLKGVNLRMKRQLIKIRRKPKENIYNKPGLDSTSVLFLCAIRENLHHQRRKELFKDYTGYQQRY